MRRLIRQLMVLFVTGFFAYTFWSTDYETPEKELRHIILEYADKGDVTGVEISIDQERVIHPNNNVIRNSIFRMVRGGVIDLSFSETLYNEKKNIARVDCSITRQGENGPVTNRNYFYMCYDTGIGWSIYDILGYSSAHKSESPEKDAWNGEAAVDEGSADNGKAVSAEGSVNNGEAVSAEGSVDNREAAGDEGSMNNGKAAGDEGSVNNGEAASDEGSVRNEEPAGGTEDLTPYFDRAATYLDCTEQEILGAVAEHYYRKYGVSDARVRLDSVDGDIWLIQVYEDMGDHENTFDWYTIDRVTVCGTTMFGQDYVDLSVYLDREPVWIYVDGASKDHIRVGHRSDGSVLEY